MRHLDRHALVVMLTLGSFSPLFAAGTMTGASPLRMPPQRSGTATERPAPTTTERPTRLERPVARPFAATPLRIHDVKS